MEQEKVKIRTFISRFIKKHELTDEEDFFELGFVNSLFATQVEKEFEIKVTNEDLTLDNFRTINNIATFVHEKLQ